MLLLVVVVVVVVVLIIIFFYRYSHSVCISIPRWVQRLEGCCGDTRARHDLVCH